MHKIRPEDDFESQSYKEFMENMERKVREDNLKAIEEEAKRPLFPTKDYPQQTSLSDLWKKGMAKKADPEDKMTESPTFEQELTDLLNKHNIDGKTGTADWILATYVITMLNAVEDLNDARNEFNK